MYTDYIDLNKACPKDAYSLPNIDHLVDDASGNTFLSFLLVFSRHNQIPMYEPNIYKTTFITKSTNFCYQVMSFGLKNTGDMYQQLMHRVFRKQIRRNMKVYVDDMIVK